MNLKIYYLILMLGLTGCTGALESSNLTTPSPANSEYFKTTGAGFNGTARDGKLVDLYYAVALKLNKPITEDLYLKVCFENPNQTSPICRDEVFSKDKKEIMLESPIVRGLINRRNYEVIVTVYDAKNTMPRSKHRQLIRYYDVRY